MLRKIAEILKELLVLIIALTGIAVTVYMQYRWDSFGHRQRALIEEGDAELAASAFDSALTLYDRALEINPHNAEALKKKKRSEEVIRAADSLVRKGEEAMRLGQLDEAYDYFVQAKKLFPLNPNDGYQRNLSVFEKDWVRTYLDALQQLDENWTAINLRLQKGETATSESVMNDIADMYPLAQAAYRASSGESKLKSPEGIEFYEEKRTMIKQLTGNLVRYGIFPENPNEGLAEKDEFIRNVQNKYQAFLERLAARKAWLRERHPDIYK